MVATKKRPSKKKNPAAVELGRRGGLKGGRARASKLTPEERSESARKAVLARWNKVKMKKELETIENSDQEEQN
jgi:hypothetical protein